MREELNETLKIDGKMQLGKARTNYLKLETGGWLRARLEEKNRGEQSSIQTIKLCDDDDGD